MAPTIINPATAFPQSQVASRSLTFRITSQSASGPVVLTRKVQVKHGQATLANVNLHQAGDYTMVISNTQGQTITQTFTVAATAPARLVFVPQPKILSGNATFSLRVTDRYGNATNAADGRIVTLQAGCRVCGRTFLRARKTG